MGPDLGGESGPEQLMLRGEANGERLSPTGDATAELSLGESGPFPTTLLAPTPPRGCNNCNKNL